MLSNPQMASLFEHGTSLSPAAKGTLRAVLRDAKTPLSSLAPVIKEWTALDPTRAPSDSVAALAPLLVWSCTRDAHAKVAHLHVLTKWTMHFKHGFEPVDVLETTKLIQSLTSCLKAVAIWGGWSTSRCRTASKRARARLGRVWGCGPGAPAGGPQRSSPSPAGAKRNWW